MAPPRRSASPAAGAGAGAGFEVAQPRTPPPAAAREARTPERGPPSVAVLPPTPSIKQEATCENAHAEERALSPSPGEDEASPSRSPTPSGEEEETRRISMYPAVLGRMIDTVLDGEAYLFSEVEQTLLRGYADLPPPSRYLFARLLQRQDVWLRLNRLRYDERDLPDISEALWHLCGAASAIKPEAPIVKPESSEDETMRFCLDSTELRFDDLASVLELLTLDELRALPCPALSKAKSSTSTRAGLISTILGAEGQRLLPGMFVQQSPSKDAKPADAAESSQTGLLKRHLRETIGEVVRIPPATRSLMTRLALVYYRAAVPDERSALTTAVLAESKRRVYPQYSFRRSERLFESRAHLIALQRASSVEAEVEMLLEQDGSKEAYEKVKTLFESVYDEWKMHVRDVEASTASAEQRQAYFRNRFHPGWPLTRVVFKGATALAHFKLYKREEEVLRALLAQRAFRRGRRGEWYDRLALILGAYSERADKGKARALEVAVAGIEDPDTHLIYQDTLQRRIVRLESQLRIAFARKHDFSYAKLATCRERVFRGTRLDAMAPPTPTPKRGPWGHSPSPSPGATEGAANERRALRKIVQVERQPSPNGAATLRRPFKMEKAVSDPMLLSAARSTSAGNGGGGYVLEERRSMATVWEGLDGKSCRVEDYVLQCYAEEGFSGFHCEGGVLRMIFALVMWDVLYAPIDGAFETPFQSAPLDLGEDSFAITRAPQIRERLAFIEETGGLQLIREADERERARRSFAIGCRWDLYTQQDLLEIAECMGGRAIAVICQMFAEEFIAGGLPDLVVWRMSDKTVRFCEVKGPGDSLRPKQKIWIDVLLRAGLQVEVSLVREGVRKRKAEAEAVAEPEDSKSGIAAAA